LKRNAICAVVVHSRLSLWLFKDGTYPPPLVKFTAMVMELSGLLLLAAFRYRIEEPGFESGLLRLATIVGHELDPTNFHAVLAEALANGYIRDPIRLPPGALQCHWHLELTPVGVDEVLRFLRQQGKTADELLADARVSSPIGSIQSRR
jgi:hypothetical protein